MNLFELSAKITADTTGFDKGIRNSQKTMAEYKRDVMRLAQTYKKQGMSMSEAMKRAYSEIDKSQYKTSENSKSNSKKFFSNWDGAISKVGAIAKTSAKIGLAALGSAATGIATLTAASVKQFAEYEQLVGGMKTLFGDAAGTVQSYAENAFKNAGMSANQYMETVTGFSSSLIQSLGGDTQKAAEKANVALEDMSDNMNKMGTPLESLRYAYQGFAKQNYTMLDNLKLGYGGTKAEMQRLLEEANQLNKQQGIHTEYQLKNYSDIIDAIHVIQQNMGITGATAAEAATTISGSVGMMKAAFGNLITGIADDNANFENLINNAVESTDTVLNLMLPRIEIALGGIVKLIDGLAPKIAARLPNLVQEIIPKLVSASAAIINSVIAALPGMLQALQTAVPPLIDGVFKAITGIVKTLPNILQTAIDIVVTLANGIAENIGELVPVLTDTIVKMAEVLTDPKNLNNIIDAALAIINALVDGLIKALPILIDAVPQIVVNIVDVLVDNIPKILEAGYDIMLALIGTFSDPETVSKVWEAIGEVMAAAVGGIIDYTAKMIAAANRIMEKVLAALKTFIPNFNGMGNRIIEGLWKGIGDKTAWIIEKIKGLGNSIISAAKNIFGIRSPSKVFAALGKEIPRGLAKGIEATTTIALAAVRALSGETIKGFRAADITETVRKTAETVSRYTKENGKKVRKDVETYNGDILKSCNQTWENVKKLQDVSYNDEVIYWQNVRSMLQSGTQARLEADAAYKDALERRNQSISDYNETALQIEKTYANNVRAVVDQLAKDTESAWDEYYRAVDNRASSIYNSLGGMFGKFESGTENTPDSLLENIKTQTKGLADWIFQLGDLEERGVSADFLQEIRELGPSAAADISQLNAMTDEQLNEYVKLWQTKTEVSKFYAMDEMQGLKDETLKKIEELNINADEKLKELKEIFKKEFKEAKSAALSEIGRLPSEFKKIGTNSGRSLASGIRSQIENIRAAAREAMDAAESRRESTGSQQPRGRGAVSVVQNIYSEAKSAADLMNEAQAQQERAVMMGV